VNHLPDGPEQSDRAFVVADPLVANSRIDEYDPALALATSDEHEVPL
jgi:hypothetical protein